MKEIYFPSLPSKNIIKELAEPDALPTDVYGQYFAGSERGIPKGDREINTDEENDLLNALQDYFRNNEKDDLETKAENEIFNLINLGKYKKYLKAPTGKKCYRIITGIPIDVAASILGIPDEQMNDVRSHNRAWAVNNSGIIKSPDSNIQGWSLDLNPKLFDNLGGISGNYKKDKTVTVLFVSNTNNGRFFINTANFSKHYELSNTVDLLPEEREVLSYGPVTFNSAAYVVFNHGLKGSNQHHLSVGLRNLGALLINALNLKTKYSIKADYDKATKAFEEIPEKQKLVADKMAALKVEVDRFEQIGFDPLIDVLRMVDKTAKKQVTISNTDQNNVYYQIKYSGIGSEDVNRIINSIEQRKETILANELEGKYEELINPTQIFWGDINSSAIIEIHNPSRTKKVTLDYNFALNELEVILDLKNRPKFNTDDKEGLLEYLIEIGMFN